MREVPAKSAARYEHQLHKKPTITGSNCCSLIILLHSSRNSLVFHNVPKNPFDFRHHLFIREVAVGLALIAFVLVFSMLFNAPLADKANPGLSPNPTKAPWYFMGIQEMLMHFHPVFAVLVIPLTLFIGLLAIPYVKYDTESSGIWFVSEKGLKLVLLAIVVG